LTHRVDPRCTPRRFGAGHHILGDSNAAVAEVVGGEQAEDDPRITEVAGERRPGHLDATLHVHDGGHVELVLNAAEQARVIEGFRRPTMTGGR
jgi:hypothetical protein